jgi:hypothetical protein
MLPLRWSLSEYRDQTVVQLLVSTVLAGVVKSAFDLLRDHLKDHWSRSKAAPNPTETIALRVGTKEIIIRRDMSPTEIDSLLMTCKKPLRQKKISRYLRVRNDPLGVS